MSTWYLEILVLVSFGAIVALYAFLRGRKAEGMGKVAFFPWFEVREPLECGVFLVRPYERGKAPGVDPEEQTALDQVVGRYREASGQPVRRAALLQHAKQASPTAPLDEDYHVDLFVFADLLAFAALANRRFFGHFEYSNRDHYRLVLQQFADPSRGVLLTTRRRDGSTNAFYTGDVFNVQRPHHVQAQGTTVDTALLCKLVDAMSHPDWPQVYQAVVLFNEANTDRLEVPPTTELVLTYAAMEQALGLPGKKPEKVAPVFSATMQPREDLPRAEWTVHHGNPRAEKLLASAPNLRGGWFEDLAVSRGSLAHGHAEEAYPACWSAAEHLLLAAHALPLVIKKRLATMAGYDFTREDEGSIEVFERLLNARHLEPRPETDAPEHPWRDIMGRQRMREAARIAAELYFSESEDPAQDQGSS